MKLRTIKKRFTRYLALCRLTEKRLPLPYREGYVWGAFEDLDQAAALIRVLRSGINVEKTNYYDPYTRAILPRRYAETILCKHSRAKALYYHHTTLADRLRFCNSR